MQAAIWVHFATSDSFSARATFLLGKGSFPATTITENNTEYIKSIMNVIK